MNYKGSFIMMKLESDFFSLILTVSQRESFHKRVNTFNKKTLTLSHVSQIVETQCRYTLNCLYFFQLKNYASYY